MISPIENGEIGSSVRAKLNQSIQAINDLPLTEIEEQGLAIASLQANQIYYQDIFPSTGRDGNILQNNDILATSSQIYRYNADADTWLPFPKPVNAPFWYPPMHLTSSVSGSVTASNYVGQSRRISGINGASLQLLTSVGNGGQAPLFGRSGVLDFSKPISLTYRFTKTNIIGSILRIGIGTIPSINMEIANKAFGVRINALSLALQIHDGTTLYTGDTIATLGATGTILEIFWDGDSKLSCFVDGVFVGAMVQPLAGTINSGCVFYSYSNGSTPTIIDIYALAVTGG